MKNVYYDVGNTLNSPFITGIQRVVREFSKSILMLEESCEVEFSFIPVLYDHRKRCWRQLRAYELKQLLGDKPRSKKFIDRVVNKVRLYIPANKALYIQKFESGSIFFDIDSSWHSVLNRSDMLPVLSKSDVHIVKLHYDIVPLLFPRMSHHNTVDLFEEHFRSHLRYADLFLCISKVSVMDVLAYCNDHNIIPPALAVIELGVNMLEFPKLVSENSQRLLDVYGKYLLCVGTLEPRKNHRILLDAFDLIRNDSDFNLVLIGKTGWLAEDIKDEICRHPCFGIRIFYLNWVSDNELDLFYRNAWLNIVPSFYEGYGLPVIESLSRDCPTISSNAGSLPEVGRSYVEYFSPNSVNELVDLLKRLESERDLYLNLSIKAKEFKQVEWRYTVSQINDFLSKMN